MNMKLNELNEMIGADKYEIAYRALSQSKRKITFLKIDATTICIKSFVKRYLVFITHFNIYVYQELK